QHVYVWLLYGVMVLRAHSIADLIALIRGRIGHVSLHRPRGWDLVGLVGGKAMFLGWAIVAPLLVYPWWIVLAGYTSSAMLGSLVIATTFQLAHCVEEADFTSPAELAASRRLWAVHEVETTVDFCPRNRVLTWLLGGLNFQIEHHLFPRVPHTDSTGRFEIATGLFGVGLVAARRGLLDPTTIGALACSAPDVEHVVPMPFGSSKLFHEGRGWHRSGSLSVRTQVVVASLVL